MQRMTLFKNPRTREAVSVTILGIFKENNDETIIQP